MENNSRYQEFLTWHSEATARCQEGESIAAPSEKFFQHWLAVREQAEASKNAEYVD